jgi:predicted  nucleic acid-binding Zn ribbon protein
MANDVDGGKSLIAEVQDTCPGCTKRWIDVSEGIFKYFADTSVGYVYSLILFC